MNPDIVSLGNSLTGGACLHYAAAWAEVAYNFQRVCGNLSVTFVTGLWSHGGKTPQRRHPRGGFECYHAPTDRQGWVQTRRAQAARSRGSGDFNGRAGLG